MIPLARTIAHSRVASAFAHNEIVLQHFVLVPHHESQQIVIGFPPRRRAGKRASDKKSVPLPTRRCQKLIRTQAKNRSLYRVGLAMRRHGIQDAVLIQIVHDLRGQFQHAGTLPAESSA